MEPILLITGFEPFGGETINPSWEAVQRLPERIGGFTLHKLQIPTVFEAAAQKVLSEAEGCQPRVILSVGQAGGRKEITPERIGVNLRRAATPDNAGNQPQGEGIVLNGPDGIFSTCPVEAMAEAVRGAGLPGRVSDSAGTFVCNDVLYTLLSHYAGTDTLVGFVHVPWLPEQGSPSLPLMDTVKGLTAAVEAIWERLDWELAKHHLHAGGYTCVLRKGERELTDTRRGVRPLLELLKSREDFEGWSVADKVVGKASALLYCLLKVKRVYAPVISRSALEVLESHGIPCEYHRLVPGIRNRTGTGPCPMEAATANITDPKEAPEVLEKTLEALTKG